MSPETPKKSVCSRTDEDDSPSGTGASRSPLAASAGGRGGPGARLRDFTAITKALADETRVRVLLTLQRGELCVCQIVELTGLATSTMSKHMSILKQARLVESRKEGRWMYYRLADDDAPAVVHQALAWATGSLAKDPQAVLDLQRIAAICNSDPQELCAGRGKGGCDCR